MKLNPNHQAYHEKAWKESGLTYGQEVVYKGKTYVTIAIGYGALLKGKVEIYNGKELLTVSVVELEVLKK